MDYSHQHAAHGGQCTALPGNVSLGHMSLCTAGDKATILLSLLFINTDKKQVWNTDDMFT